MFGVVVRHGAMKAMHTSQSYLLVGTIELCLDNDQ